MNDHCIKPYLPAGLPAPLDDDGVAGPYWSGLRQGVLRVQRCSTCQSWQFGGEWICHHCQAFDPPWVAVAPQGLIYSWQRIWHPVHPALKGHGPYLALVVELPQAGGLRMVGNLLGDVMQAVVIGAAVRGVFEHHRQSHPPYSLLQWRRE